MKLLAILFALFPFLSTYAEEIQRSYAVVIIGGGPAGLACATACAKTGYPTLVCDEEKRGIFYPGLPMTNWPGFPAPTWQKALEGLRNEFTKQGGIFTSAHVKAITKNQGIFHISTDIGVFHSPAVVMATGKEPLPCRTALTTEEPTRVLSRLYDESFLTPIDTVILIGNSEQTFSCAVRIAPRVKRLYLFLQSPWKSTGSFLERLARRLPTITWIKCDKIVSINSLKTKVIVESLHRGSKTTQEASWVVFSDEWIPKSALIRGLTSTDSTGAIITYDDTGMTPSSGLFACGEVSSRGFLNGISAAANGLNTSVAVTQFLLNRGPLPNLQMVPKEETPAKAPPPAGETGPAAS